MSSSAFTSALKAQRAERIAADSLIQAALQGSSLTYRLDYEMQSNLGGEYRVTICAGRQTLATAVGLLLGSDELHEAFIVSVHAVDGRFDLLLRARPGLRY